MQRSLMFICAALTVQCAVAGREEADHFGVSLIWCSHRVMLPNGEVKRGFGHCGLTNCANSRLPFVKSLQAELYWPYIQP